MNRRHLLEKDANEIEAHQSRVLEHHHGKPVYYWIYVPSTRTLVGYKATEDDAYMYGYSKLNERHFEVIPLPTINRGAATAMIKGRELSQTGNLDNSLRRLKHKT